MKKGLTVTLLAVAVAMMSIQAMAMAPVIGDVPSPIIGDAETVTPANLFVYPDALNMANYVTDDETAPADIAWSYEIVGQAKYMINGVDPMNTGGGDDPVAPGAKQINNQVLSGEENPDGNPATLTFRNINLSPFGGPNVDPGAPGIVDSETQLVTLYASDGTSFSEASIFVYTDNDGNDRLSTEEIPVVEFTYEGSLEGWEWVKVGGEISSDTAGGTALCIVTALEGENWGYWESSYGGTLGLPLVNNAVYKLRATMNSSQTTPGTVPFWDLIIMNFKVPGTDGKPWSGFNLYGVNYHFLDNLGGANAIYQSQDGTDVLVYWCPAPMLTPQFQTLFDPANADDKDGIFQFRILDNDSNPGITAWLKSGTLCMTNLKVTRKDISQITTLQTDLYNATMSDSAQGGSMYYELYNSATVAFDNGVMTITPTESGRDSMLVQVAPGDANNNWEVPSTLPDNYPVPWEASTLYRVTIEMSAPTEADATNAPGVIWIGADTPTNELINLSWFTAGLNGAAMPKTGAAQEYVMFYWSWNVTLDPTPEFHTLRPRLQAGNARALGLVFPNNDNSGAFSIHRMKVDKNAF
jgi:hypothetical protein